MTAKRLPLKIKLDAPKINLRIYSFTFKIEGDNYAGFFVNKVAPEFLGKFKTFFPEQSIAGDAGWYYSVYNAFCEEECACRIARGHESIRITSYCEDESIVHQLIIILYDDNLRKFESVLSKGFAYTGVGIIQDSDRLYSVTKDLVSEQCTLPENRAIIQKAVLKRIRDSGHNRKTPR